MDITRTWAMPNRWTFTIHPVKSLLREFDFRSENWADPFAGYNSPASLTNDLDPESPAKSHLDALEFLKSIESESCDGVLYDPPYSFRQASECYKNNGRDKLTATVTSKKYWAEVKNECARILKVGGTAICFGWNSNGLGKSRGFKMVKVLLIPHGGSMNDTLVTVEEKAPPTPN